MTTPTRFWNDDCKVLSSHWSLFDRGNYLKANFSTQEHYKSWFILNEYNLLDSPIEPKTDITNIDTIREDVCERITKRYPLPVSESAPQKNKTTTNNTNQTQSSTSTTTTTTVITTTTMITTTSSFRKRKDNKSNDNTTQTIKVDSKKNTSKRTKGQQTEGSFKEIEEEKKNNNESEEAKEKKTKVDSKNKTSCKRKRQQTKESTNEKEKEKEEKKSDDKTEEVKEEKKKRIMKRTTPIKGVLRARRIKLNPTPTQKTALKRWFGCCRSLYNDTIEIFNKHIKEGLGKPDKLKVRDFLIVTDKSKNNNDDNDNDDSKKTTKKKRTKKKMKLQEEQEKEQEKEEKKKEKTEKVCRLTEEEKIEKEKRDSKRQWHLEIPRHTRDEAVMDAFKAWESNAAKKKINPKHRFTLHFKKKKATSDSIHVDKSAISLAKGKVFERMLKGPRIFSRRSIRGIDEIGGNCRLIRKHSDQYYLSITIDKPIRCMDIINEKEQKNKKDINNNIINTTITTQQMEIDEGNTNWMNTKGVKEQPMRAKLVALDPGVRTFLTGYSPDQERIVEIGKSDHGRIFRLCKHLDKMISKLKNKEYWKKEFPNHNKKRKHIYYHIKAMERLRDRIRNLVDEVHRKAAHYLVSNFSTIMIPLFETSNMVRKKKKDDKQDKSNHEHGDESKNKDNNDETEEEKKNKHKKKEHNAVSNIKRKINSKTARMMLTWSHYRFRMRLISKAQEIKDTRVIVVDESYTTKTCTRCGNINNNVGSSKVFRCPLCGLIIDRDFNGCRNIALRNLAKENTPQTNTTSSFLSTSTITPNSRNKGKGKNDKKSASERVISHDALCETPTLQIVSCKIPKSSQKIPQSNLGVLQTEF